MTEQGDDSTYDAQQVGGSPQLACPSLSPSAIAVLEEYGAHTVAPAVRATGELAAACDGRLADCTLFCVGEEDRLQMLLNEDTNLGSEIFWIEVNQLIISSIRSFYHSFQKLVCGIGESVAARNDLSAALTIRALLEHAGTLDQLSSKLAPLEGEITTNIWPSWMRGSLTAPPSDRHHDLRRALVRYIAGYRTEVSTNDIPLPTDSNAKWQKFTKECEKAAPDDLRALSPMTGIDSISRQRGCKHVHLLYALLCEYVHPNSSSRNADFVQTVDSLGARTLSLKPSMGFARGFKRVLYIGQEAILKSCERISRALEVLSKCVLPITPTPGSAAHEAPPIGSILAHDPHGRLFWVSPKNIVRDPKRKLHKLSEEQVERTRKLAQVFEEVYPQSLDDWCSNFAYNPDPEREIREFEHMAVVFVDELAERKDSTRSERRMLYGVLIMAAWFSTVSELLSSRPQLKSLAHIERVFKRAKS